MGDSNQHGAHRKTQVPARERVPRWSNESIAILTEVVHDLRSSDGADYRARFERVVSQRTGFPYVRLCDAPAEAGDRPRQPLCCVVPWDVRETLLEAGSHVGPDLRDPKKRRQLRAAAQAAAVVLQLEATHRAKPAPAFMPIVDPDEHPLLGSSAVMDSLRRRIARVARLDFRVLIEGETGAGKEVVARQIHRLSARASGPFVAVNCAALVESLMDAQLFGIDERVATGVRAQRGVFEKADGGVLFLDEIGELPLQAQAKILRVLQEGKCERLGGSAPRKINVRLIAATNKSLERMVDCGQFREDLYYRIQAVQIRVPSLREHPDDIQELAMAHLRYGAGAGTTRVSRIAPDAIEALLVYGWPGNVRQLQRVLERAVTEGDGEEIRLADLPEAVRSPYAQVVRSDGVRDESMQAWRARYARLVLSRCGDNKRRACETLKISYHTLRAYLSATPPTDEGGGS